MLDNLLYALLAFVWGFLGLTSLALKGHFWRAQTVIATILTGMYAYAAVTR